MSEFEPGKFYIMGSVWFVVDHTKAPIDMPANVAVTPSLAVACFTDPDLAQRFASDLGQPQMSPVEVATTDVLLGFLRSLIEAGHERIAVDPGPGQDGRIATLLDFVGSIEKAR